MLASLPWLFMHLHSERLYLISITEFSEYFLIESIHKRKALITPVLCKQNHCLAFKNWQEHRFQKDDWESTTSKQDVTYLMYCNLNFQQDEGKIEFFE